MAGLGRFLASSSSASVSITSSSVSVSSSSSSHTRAVLIDSRGSGGTADLHFSVSGPWQLNASWSCPDAGLGFQLELTTQEGALVSRISGTGTGHAERAFAGAGSYRIKIKASCPWHVLVQG